MKLNIFILILIIGILIYFLKRNKEGLNTDDYSLTLYYADWCGDCRKSTPKYDELGTNYNARKNIYSRIKTVTITKVHCDPANLSQECENITKYPTIELKKLNPPFTAPYSEKKEYTGDIDEQKIKNWLNKKAI